MNALFNHLENSPVFNDSQVAVRMTDAEVETLRKSLFRDKRVNVCANRFNSKIPYQVSTRWSDASTKEVTWTNYGRFTNLDVAAYVGSIAGIAIYGSKALRGNFDAAKATAHPECIAWLADPRNQEVILKAQENLDGTVGA